MTAGRTMGDCSREASLRTQPLSYYCGYLALLLVVILVSGETQGKELGSSCLPPPFLYVTFHGGSGKHDVNNIKRYSRDGCDLGYVIDSNDAESQ